MEDQPQLSQGFFQMFLDEKVPSDFQPILQVLEARSISSSTATPQGQQMRARLSDSLYSYSGNIIPSTMTRRFQEDGLNSHNGIIQVTNWKRVNTNGKICLQILDYTLYSLDFPVIGNPQTHSGNPAEFRRKGPVSQQTAAESVALWRNTQMKEEPENAWGGGTGGSAKRGRGSSPTDQRQPLRKRQADGEAYGSMGRMGITPIEVINPYINRWRICGVVSSKDAAIKDLTSVAIRIAAFGEQADKFFPIIENANAYYISGNGGPRSVRAANKRFNATGHDYELVLDRDSEVVYCDEQFETPKLKLKPILLKDLPNHVNECVDVHAIVDRVGEVSQVTSRKDMRQFDKRDIFLATTFHATPGTVLGINGASVREFNAGFSLSTTSATSLLLNPEGKISERLCLWYRESKPHVNIKSLSIGSNADTQASFERDFRLIGLIRRDGVGRDNDKGEFFFVKAMVTTVKSEQALYQACPQLGCKKKVSMEGNQYRCEKCANTFDTYKNIMMLQVELADFSGETWATIFEERAEALLGVKADQLAQWQREDPARFDSAFDIVRFREFLFRVGVRYEMYNDKSRLKWTVFNIQPVPLAKCKTFFEQSVQKMEGI
uniref:Replication protein A subunit n=1 Tax=Globodera rostochiensis TaxID=31243 RepID=A0A914H1U3_GLORO